MASRKPSDHGTGIPLHEVEALARVLLPEIQKFFESEEGQGVSGVEEAAKQRIKSAAGHLKWMPRRFVSQRILLIEMINPNPSPTWGAAFGLSWIVVCCQRRCVCQIYEYTEWKLCEKI